MGKLKPGTNEGYPQAEPGQVLLQINEVNWLQYDEGDNQGETYCELKMEIIDSDVAENIGKPMNDRFNQFEANGGYWGVINLLGVLWKVTGDAKEADEDYFLDKAVQKKVAKVLTNGTYGAEVVVSTAKKTGKEYRNLRSYISKDEYKDLVKANKKSGGKADAGKAKDKEGKGDTGSDDGDDDW